MSIESVNNSSESQASGMAQRAGIELTPRQIVQYVQYRSGSFNQETSELSIPPNTSDQRLLDMLLTSEQRDIFRLHYPHIFQPGSRPGVETATTDHGSRAPMQLLQQDRS